MGLLGLSRICEQLISHGMDAGTPIAVVQQGTTSNQRVLTAELATPALAASSRIKAPTIIIMAGS